jgi:hypothetical protein
VRRAKLRNIARQVPGSDFNKLLGGDKEEVSRFIQSPIVGQLQANGVMGPDGALGEINAFYVKIPVWDTILHTTNGFLMAAIGFALIDLFNRSDRFSIKMSPYFVAFFAFCFSMTVGVLWEFFEFSMDWFFRLDMQKDWIVPAINSVKLNVFPKKDRIRIPSKNPKSAKRVTINAFLDAAIAVGFV